MDRCLWLLVLISLLAMLGCEDTCSPSAHRIQASDTSYHCGAGTVVSKEDNFIVCQCPKGTKVVPSTDAGSGDN